MEIAEIGYSKPVRLVPDPLHHAQGVVASGYFYGVIRSQRKNFFLLLCYGDELDILHSELPEYLRHG